MGGWGKGATGGKPPGYGDLSFFRRPSPIPNGYSGTGTHHPQVIPRVTRVHGYPQVSLGTITNTRGTRGTRRFKSGLACPRSRMPVAFVVATLSRCRPLYHILMILYMYLYMYLLNVHEAA